jgi:hypothetical protein
MKSITSMKSILQVTGLALAIAMVSLGSVFANTNETVIAWGEQWGWSNAVQVAGDYDGDGAYDLAVFDPVAAEWYIKSATNGVITWKNQWGWNGAKPVSGDFDGDGQFDLAVVDPLSGKWYIKSLATTNRVNANEITVSPTNASLTYDGEQVVLTVTGGTAPFTWLVDDMSLGIMVNSPNVSRSEVYERLHFINNSIKIIDSLGNTVSVVIKQP